MPSTNTISIDELARPIVTPNCPVFNDVPTDEDFTADSRLIPGSTRRPWPKAPERAKEVTGHSTIVICQKDLKLSRGVAAWLRHEGVEADSLDGGALAWAQAGLPMVSEPVLPRRDVQGRAVWVTRARPKVDRIACPRLVRRFVDPQAVFLIVSPSEVAAVARRFGAAAFDIEDEGVFWSHRGERCTFDAMVEEFGLATEPLMRLATSCSSSPEWPSMTPSTAGAGMPPARSTTGP